MARWESKSFQRRRFHNVCFKIERPERGGCAQHLHDHCNTEQAMEKHGNKPDLS